MMIKVIIACGASATHFSFIFVSVIIIGGAEARRPPARSAEVVLVLDLSFLLFTL